MQKFITGNTIQLIRNGAEFFPALLGAIKHAQQEIYLQTYIYEPDKIGHQIGDALKNAAKRGVLVNILLDGFGSKELPAEFVEELQKENVNVMFYRPKISPWTLKKSRLRRMHRKVTVIDKKIAFVGGINIIDDYNVPDGMPPRIDYAVRIEGKLLPTIWDSVNKLWTRISVTHLQVDQLLQKDSTHVPVEKTTDDVDESISNASAAFVLRDNVLNRRSIENAYLAAIKQAQSEIIIANAYFVPGRRFRKALIAATKRGVCVKLLLQGQMEYFLMFATHAFYAGFMKKNIEIYEYRKGYMHSKVAVIDKLWATVGSSNIDPFSLLLAREANVIVKNKQFANALRNDILLSIEKDAYRILPEEWTSRHFYSRFLSWLAYGVVRGLVGLIGYSKQH